MNAPERLRLGSQWDPLALVDLLYLAEHMRESDKAMVRASRWDQDIEAWAIGKYRGGGSHGTMFFDGEPVMCGGIDFISPGVCLLWFVATDRLSDVAVRTIFIGRNLARHALKSPEVHRVEALCDASDQRARRLIELCGLTYEGTHRKASGGGLDIAVFAKVKETGG